MTDPAADFIGIKADIDDLLDKLREASDGHFGISPDSVTVEKLFHLRCIRRALTEAEDEFTKVAQ